MSAATENYVDSLKADLERSQWRVDVLEATIEQLQKIIALHALNEAVRNNHICTAGNNGDRPGDRL